MSAIDLLNRTRTPTDAEIETIDNVCRCGTYFRIREAVKRAAQLMNERDKATATPAPAPAPTPSPTPTSGGLLGGVSGVVGGITGPLGL